MPERTIADNLELHFVVSKSPLFAYVLLAPNCHGEFVTMQATSHPQLATTAKRFDY
jgi:hypothetical protein